MSRVTKLRKKTLQHKLDTEKHKEKRAIKRRAIPSLLFRIKYWMGATAPTA